MTKPSTTLLICSAVIVSALAFLASHSRYDPTVSMDSVDSSELVAENAELRAQIDQPSELLLYSDDEAARFADLAKTVDLDHQPMELKHNVRTIEGLFERLQIDMRKTRRGVPNIGNDLEWRSYQLSPSYWLHATIRLPNIIINFEIRRYPVN